MDIIRKQYLDDEIDLRELLKTIWRNKLLILAITTIFGVTGVVYALLAPQVWSAKAIVVTPLPEQLEQLQLRLENSVALMDITKNTLITTQNDSVITEKRLIGTYNQSGFLEAFSAKALFADFIRAFDSLDNKYDFLKTKDTLPKEDMRDRSALQRYLEESAKKISVKQMKDGELVILSFGDDDAQNALKLLHEYINFIQNKEAGTKNQLLVDKIANQIDALTLSYRVQEAETLKRLQEDIRRTEFALRISRTAGIEVPVQNLNNQSIFAIDLGAKVLNEKLNILKEIKNPVLINPILADIRLQLDSLQAVPQGNVSFASYHFLQSPTEPLSRDKPKRSLAVVLATLAGLLVGVVVALIRASWISEE